MRARVCHTLQHLPNLLSFLFSLTVSHILSNAISDVFYCSLVRTHIGGGGAGCAVSHTDHNCFSRACPTRSFFLYSLLWLVNGKRFVKRPIKVVSREAPEVLLLLQPQPVIWQPKQARTELVRTHDCCPRRRGETRALLVVLRQSGPNGEIGLSDNKLGTIH